MKKYAYLTTLWICLLFSSTLRADTLGVWAGAGFWDWEVSGKFRYQTTNTSNDIDVKNDLQWADDDTNTAFVIIEHPIPVIPNIKVQTSSVDTSGTGVLGGIQFGGTTFSTTVSSSLEFDQTDLTLYYQILDNVVGLDLGLNAKLIDGKIAITETTGLLRTETATFDATIPMLYLGVDVALPLTGLTIGVNGGWVSYDGSSVTDLHAYIRYTSDYFIGAEAGVKNMNIELDDIDDSYGELDFEGVYAVLFLHF